MSLGRAVVDLDLPLQLKRAADRPLHRQIVAQLRDAIRAGQLPAGTRLPSTRRLAAALDITRNVAVAAYATSSPTGTSRVLTDRAPMLRRRCPRSRALSCRR